MSVLIKLLGIVFPIVLFLFRYIFPAQFEKALSQKKQEEKQVIIELLHFPNEMLMISVGYTIPKTIEYLRLLGGSTVGAESTVSLLLNILFSMIIIGCLPFVVARTKIIEKYYFKGEHRKVRVQSIVLYVLCVIAIIISLILGV